MEVFRKQKNPKMHECILCNFITTNKKDFARHLVTKKHIVNDMAQGSGKTPENPKIPDDVSHHECSCGKIYKNSSGLWKHTQKCNINPTSKEENIDELYVMDSAKQTELLAYLMKENTEFKEMLLEQSKLIMKMSENHNCIHTSNVNSHNKTFNLQFFLNETCKDAMNIMDFIDSVKLQLSDLETIGSAGFVNGISNVIIKSLNDLDVTKRPLHCTDSKREVLYVKDENKWEKESEEKTQMRKVINHISHKNIKQIPLWVEENPTCKDVESNINTKYLHILSQSMGCTDPKNYDKIIHNISKEVIVDK